MSSWDPWWAHGDYADTYHGSAEDDQSEEEEMSRFYDKDVLRRAHQISADQTRRGEVGDWIGAHHQAYRERVRTPLERSIEREWGDTYQEPPCRRSSGACNEVTKACLRCSAPWGQPCPRDKASEPEAKS